MTRHDPGPAVQFGRMLTQLAQDRRPDISLWDLAREVGCETGLMSRLAQGKRRPPVKYVKPLADALRLKGEERRTFLRSGLEAFLGEDHDAVVRLLKDV